MSSPAVFSGVRVTRSLVLYVCFVDRCLSFSLWPLRCLFFYLRILITPLVFQTLLMTLADVSYLIKIHCTCICFLHWVEINQHIWIYNNLFVIYIYLNFVCKHSVRTAKTWLLYTMESVKLQQNDKSGSSSSSLVSVVRVVHVQLHVFTCFVPCCDVRYDSAWRRCSVSHYPHFFLRDTCSIVYGSSTSL